MATQRRTPTPPGQTTTRVPVHAFEPGESFRDHLDHEVTYCAVCKVAGEPGDPRHPDGALPYLPPVPEQVRRVEARRLGESYE